MSGSEPPPATRSRTAATFSAVSAATALAITSTLPASSALGVNCAADAFTT